MVCTRLVHCPASCCVTARMSPLGLAFGISALLIAVFLSLATVSLRTTLVRT